MSNLEDLEITFPCYNTSINGVRKQDR